MLNAIALFFDNPEIFNPDRWADNLQKRLILGVGKCTF